MKLLLIPFFLLSFSTLAKAQVRTTPPPPPPRAKTDTSKRDIRIIKEQSQEIQNLKAEILALQARVKRLQAERSLNKGASQAPQMQKSLAPKPQQKEKATEIKKKQVVKKGKNKRKPTSAVFKSGLNKFQKNCSMFAQPNPQSKKVGSVSAGKKLWIDAYNSTWRKAYKKSGTVYVHRDCF